MATAVKTRLSARRWMLVAAALALLGVVGALLYYLPIWHVDSNPWLGSLYPKERFELENEARRTLAQILLSLVGSIALYVAYLRVRAMDQRVAVEQEGQITERFTRATEMLGATKERDGPALEIDSERFSL